jgi:hypothetical protein
MNYSLVCSYLNPCSSDLSFATDMKDKLHENHDTCLSRQSLQCELSAGNNNRFFFYSLALAQMLLVVVPTEPVKLSSHDINKYIQK